MIELGTNTTESADSERSILGNNWRRSRTKAGELLRKRRRSLHWTQEQAAKHVGYSTVHYMRIERGETYLAIDSIWTFADVFHIDESKLTKAALDDRLPNGWEAIER